MADKELGITVTGNLSDIEAKIQELTSLLNNINDVKIDANMDTESIKADIESLQEALTDLDNEVITPEVATEGISDVSTAAESAKGDMEDLGESGKEAGSMIEEGMGIASLAVLALGSDVETTAQKLGDLSVSYAKLGSSFEGGSGALRDQVATITDTEFPEDEALTYISLLKRMGVAQEDLVGSADDLNKIRSATQSSVSDMTPLLQGLRAMNYDVSNLEGAYDALYFANAKYVNGLPAFSSDLMKYSSYFNEMGLNIDQAAVVLVQAQKKWPNPREMRTNLKKAVDESDGDLSKFASSLGMTTDEIINADSTTGQFAGKIEQVSQQYEQTATTTEKVDAATADLNTRYGDITKTLYDAGGAVYSFSKGISEAWLIAKAAFKVGILEEDYAAKFIEKPLMKGVDKIKSFGGKVKPLMDDLGKILTKPFTKAKVPELISPEMLSGVDDGFAQMESKIAQKSGGFTDDLVKTLEKAVPKVKVPAGLIPEGIGSTLTKGIGKIAPKVLGEGATIGILFGQGMYNALDNTKKGLGTLLVEIFSLDLLKDIPVIGDMVSQAEWFLNLIGTPEQWATVLVGKQNVEKMQAWLAGVQEWTRQSWDWIVAWVMNLPAAVGEGAAQLYEAAKSLWDQFVKGFTEAFSPVTTLLSDAETTIKDGFQWLIDLPGKAWQWGWDIIDSWKQGLLDGLRGLPGWMKKALEPITGPIESHSPPKEGPLSQVDVWGKNIGTTFGQSIGSGIDNSTTTVNSSANAMGSNLVSGVSDGVTANLSTVESALQSLSDLLIAYAGKANTWGYNAGVSFASGMKDGLGGDAAKGLVGGGLSSLSGVVESNSPPREGPLSMIDVWGENIGRTFVESIGLGISGSSLDSALGGFNLSRFALPAAATTGLTTTGASIPVTINLTLPSMSSREEAVQYGEAAGQAAGQSFAEVLRGQATNAGVSTINMMR